MNKLTVERQIVTNDPTLKSTEFNASIDAACKRLSLDNGTIAQMAGLHSPKRLFMLRSGGSHSQIRLSEIPGLASALRLRAIDLLALHLKEAAPELYKAMATEAAATSSCNIQ